MESTSRNNGINAIKQARKFSNVVRSNLSHQETNRIRKKHSKSQIGKISEFSLSKKH